MATYAIMNTPALAENNTTSYQLDDIIITSDLRESKETDMAASVDVWETFTLQDQGATHFDDVILEIPNVNFAGQSSRPRHIQIRGMGERDDYTGAPNASVGFAVDDIDFSGIGMVGSLFDVKQVEILRGSQATRYGANALAGLINIQTNDPSEEFEGMIEATGGQKNLKEVGAVISGPVSDAENSPLYRLTVQKHESDGFYHNAYLNRDDTNGQDELNIRGKLRFFPSNETTVDITMMHANLDNGYDAWSLDNSFTTNSDEPGQDTQQTSAGALKIKSNENKAFTFISTTTVADSSMAYGYDGDWAYTGYHTTGDNTYVYNNDKDHTTMSQELRFLSTPESKLFAGTTNWLVGLYGEKLEEKNHTEDNYGTDLRSDYEVTKLALFSQLDYDLTEKTTLSGGIRVENFAADFTNSNNEAFSPDETMVGGHISIDHQLDETKNLYATLSQGYKVGGFNTGLPNGADRTLLTFDKETATSIETGIKTRSEDIKTQLSAFYIDRNNPQFDGYTYVGTNYTYFTENFDKAINYGVEAELDWQATSVINLFGSLGLLQTEVEGESYQNVFTVDGRDQAHAPSYQFSLGGQYRGDNGFFARANVRGMDAFYFDNVHDQKSEAYTVTDARIGYEADVWEAYLWGRNIFDDTYATRGFYFANEPTYTDTQRYIRLGDGRQFGITARYRF